MLFKITLRTWKRGYVISEIMIREYDEFLIYRNLDLLVPNLTRSRRDLKKRLLARWYFLIAFSPVCLKITTFNKMFYR